MVIVVVHIFTVTFVTIINRKKKELLYIVITIVFVLVQTVLVPLVTVTFVTII